MNHALEAQTGDLFTGLTSRGPAGTQVNTLYSYALKETVIEAVGTGWESECILLIILSSEKLTPVQDTFESMNLSLP